jgi:CHAD domain
MSNYLLLPECHASMLRAQILLLRKLKDHFLEESNSQTIQDLRTASGKLTEMLQYVENEVPRKLNTRLVEISRKIAKHLNRICILESSIELLDDFSARQKADSIAMELLRNVQNKELIKRRKKAERYLTKKFRQYEKFLAQLKGSRSLQLAKSNVLEARMKDFLAYSWNLTPEDQTLQDLSNRTKRLAYAVEIQQRISRTKQGRFLSRIGNLQKLLTEIYNLAVFQESVRRLRKDWNVPDLKLIPTSLAQLSKNILHEKSALYSQVYPLFAKIVAAFPSALRSVQAKPVGSASSIGKLPKSKSSMRHPLHFKRFA